MKFLGDEALEHLRRVTAEPDLSGTKYSLVREIGRGGMGCVYLVRDQELGRDVALKVTAEAMSGARLRREARVLADLEHPGIVPVHDAGELPDGRHYYVMKLVRGERLDAWASDNPELGAKLRLFQRICEAVAFAHARGVLHRDLKPENVMVGAFGEALVMDWGIAKQIGSDTPVEPPLGTSAPAGPDTAQGAIMGTPAYMAPEQARGDIEALDARTDVYALGAILYFLLAGRPPFDGPDLEATLRQVIDSPPAAFEPAVPRPLASICARALAKDPSARYPDALALAEDVGRFVDGRSVEAHRESPLERAARFAARHRALLALLAAYLLARIVLALW